MAARTVPDLRLVGDDDERQEAAAERFLDSVRECIQADHESATRLDSRRLAAQSLDDSIGHGRAVALLHAAGITPEAIAWLWPGWLAKGKMHIIGGAPGTGKTTIAVSLAAVVSTGGLWPDGHRAPAGNVIIWSGEDDPADTLTPRLIASGAEMTRIWFVGDTNDHGERRAFDPSRDTAALRHAIAEAGGAALMVIDPIVSAIAGDSHKNAEVRRGLQPLADLASDLGCALLGITHFSKGTSGREPTERITGSLAFGAVARVVMVAAKSADDDGKRLFIRAKSNIGPDDGGFEYDLHQDELDAVPGVFASHVVWGEPVDGAARDLLAVAEAVVEAGEGGALSDAIDFLNDVLTSGSLPVSEVKKMARADGISDRTLARAREKLGVKAERQGFGKSTTWFLPSVPLVPKNPIDAT
jgi:putative DNA primase/helicase